MEKEPSIEWWWEKVARETAREMYWYKKDFEFALTSAVHNCNEPREHIDTDIKEKIRKTTEELLKNPEEL